MKVYNETKTELLEDYDLTKGYLKEDRIIIKTIPAQEEIAEQYHYEYKEYANGGKDRLKIVDREYQPPKAETYEYEEIQIFIPYTKQEIAKNKLIDLKQWFDIDYMRLEQKFRRLHTLGKDYKGISAYDALIQLYNHAEEVRAKINELEAIIDN